MLHKSVQRLGADELACMGDAVDGMSSSCSRPQAGQTSQGLASQEATQRASPVRV
jgi:hypothetical protein